MKSIKSFVIRRHVFPRGQATIVGNSLSYDNAMKRCRNIARKEVAEQMDKDNDMSISFENFGAKVKYLNRNVAKLEEENYGLNLPLEYEFDTVEYTVCEESIMFGEGMRLKDWRACRLLMTYRQSPFSEYDADDADDLIYLYPGYCFIELAAGREDYHLILESKEYWGSLSDMEFILYQWYQEQ